MVPHIIRGGRCPSLQALEDWIFSNKQFRDQRLDLCKELLINGELTFWRPALYQSSYRSTNFHSFLLSIDIVRLSLLEMMLVFFGKL